MWMEARGWESGDRGGSPSLEGPWPCLPLTTEPVLPSALLAGPQPVRGRGTWLKSVCCLQLCLSLL